MRKILFLIACVLCVSASAQSVRMRDVFAAMPDSLMPLVTKNNRLDCIDFIENNMEAKVRNRADEYVELKRLTADYLLFETSEASRVEMKMLTIDTAQVVCVVRTYMGPAADSDVKFYKTDWDRADDTVVALLNGDKPGIEAFFGDEVAESANATLIEMLQDLPLMEACLSAEDATITWSIGLDALPKKEKEVAQKLVKPVKRLLVGNR